MCIRDSLEVDALAAMTEWIDRYQRAAEARYGRLEAVLAPCLLYTSRCV